MGRNLWQCATLAALGFSGIGYMNTPDARYVYQDGQYGVIGIPRNTSLGKKDYRQQAHELMIKHFPEGYEIVRAEEVVEGERTLDTARKVEMESDPGVAALNQMIRVGRLAKSTSLDQKDTLKITESRIIYRRKSDGQWTSNDGFTSLSSLGPEFYIDPNELVRKELKEGSFLFKKDGHPFEKDKRLVATGAKETKETKIDPEIQKASTPIPK